MGNWGKCFSALLVFFTIMGCAKQKQNVSPNNPAPEPVCNGSKLGPEEGDYEVYSSVLKDMFSPVNEAMIKKEMHSEKLLTKNATLKTNTIVLDQMTKFRDNDSDETRMFLFEQLPALQNDTFDDFTRKNATSYCLSNSFSANFNYVILSDPDIDKIFAKNGGSSGWPAFYAKYPDSPGITRFSRAGFNSTKDQALVCVDNTREDLWGAGYCMVLTKNNNTWKVEQNVMMWIS